MIAIRDLGDAVKENPDAPDYVQTLAGFAQLARGRWDAARRDISVFWNVFGNDPDLKAPDDGKLL